MWKSETVLLIGARTMLGHFPSKIMSIVYNRNFPNINSHEKIFSTKGFLWKLILLLLFASLRLSLHTCVNLFKNCLTVLSKVIYFFTNFRNCSCFHNQLSANNQLVRKIWDCNAHTSVEIFGLKSTTGVKVHKRNC